MNVGAAKEGTVQDIAENQAENITFFELPFRELRV